MPIVVLMIGNAWLRESVYGPRVGELRGHQISTLTGALLLGGYAWLVFDRLGVRTAADAWGVGLVWLALTVAFEFLFGHYVVGHSWERLLRDYDLRAGRVWALLLVWVVLAPRVILWLRGA